MFYKSTRNGALKITSAEAVVKGISDDGGLFLPYEIPRLNLGEIIRLGDMSYPSRAAYILSKFLDDFNASELSLITMKAYGKNFDVPDVAALKRLAEDMYILELWHGPTCAFKDMALQILPLLMTTAVKKLNINKKTLILAATSGDTGKAALEGFKDVSGAEIAVFYPNGGVSETQRLQMATQEGRNVHVCAVEGNFDDCQNGVKSVFTDSEINAGLDEKGVGLSSANSINWGRLAPQIVYYISAYATLVKEGGVKNGEKINIAVPTGNFGNILAAWYAKEMGLPVNRLICASNINNVLTDFINTGIYNGKREFFTTISPSMDILVSSNLERLLYLLCGEDDGIIKEWFGKLSKEGFYEVSDEVKQKLRGTFFASYCDDAGTKDVIKKVFNKYSYVLDPHTAVAVKAYEDYKKQTGDKTITIIAGTASPFKFSGSVIEALEGKNPYSDEFDMAERLKELSGLEIPEAISGLKSKSIRFSDCVKKDGMKQYVKDLLK